MKNIIYTLILLPFFISCNKEKIDNTHKEYLDKILELVISENKINQEYFFKINSDKEILEYKISYLGIIETKRGNKLKFITSTVYSGLFEESKKANTRVFIYDNQNEKLGYYYVGGVFDRPSKISGNELIFSFNTDDCNQTTKINFQDSIPKQIYIKCTETGGNLYNFSAKR